MHWNKKRGKVVIWLPSDGTCGNSPKNICYPTPPKISATQLPPKYLPLGLHDGCTGTRKGARWRFGSHQMEHVA